ncbi:MAG: hypothetical protein F6K19_14430 [Cyanothece sp. SIO1E1]|nr:hypothetical protein [Cyanothece sp. SIO1E1]
MSEITEIFIVKLKNPARAVAIRERARADFLGIEGVKSWQTLKSTNPNKATLFAEIFTFTDLETAQRIGPTFGERPMTKAFQHEIAEMLVGQCFAELSTSNNQNEK